MPSIFPRRNCARGCDTEPLIPVSLTMRALRSRGTLPYRHSGNSVYDLDRQSEPNVLRHHFNFSNIVEAGTAEEIHNFFDEALRSRSSRCQRNRAHPCEPLGADGLVVLDEMRRRAIVSC